ncbi:putative phosphotransacetylase protein [Candidatus Kuenenia stuttgartiensis]|uniref:Putative phosphotransacetylase protein n=1 Tax=Kuenenia stuttgartiensis TaxID=174633 RepID=A0A2C9CCN4_KUEST|nr:putative phosphotransacetylase protein [Candidatus Kuenenia stuttgartiensis]
MRRVYDTSIYCIFIAPFREKSHLRRPGLKLKKDGYNIGYFKPVGFSPVFVDDVLTDEDAVFLSRALDVNEPLQSISPVIFTEDMLQRLVKGENLNIREKTMEAFHIASSGKDIMIIRGIGRLTCGTCLGFSELDFITEVNAKVYLLINSNHTLKCLTASSMLQMY